MRLRMNKKALADTNERIFMNNIKKFLDSLYLGDRFCERMEIRDDKIVFQINCISRLEEGSIEWNYYSSKDIEHGCLHFQSAEKL